MMTGRDGIRSRTLVDQDGSDRRAQQDWRMSKAKAAIVDFRGGRAGALIRLTTIGSGLA
jgi:hypothetical protein